VENLVALHQAAIVAGIDPAQPVYRQVHLRQLFAGKLAVAAGATVKDQQAGAWRVQQKTVCRAIVEFGFLHVGCLWRRGMCGGHHSGRCASGQEGRYPVLKRAVLY